MHQVTREDADAVLALGADGLPILEELLSQLVHLQQDGESEKKGYSAGSGMRNNVTKAG